MRRPSTLRKLWVPAAGSKRCTLNSPLLASWAEARWAPRASERAQQAATRRDHRRVVLIAPLGIEILGRSAKCAWPESVDAHLKRVHFQVQRWVFHAAVMPWPSAELRASLRWGRKR